MNKARRLEIAAAVVCVLIWAYVAWSFSPAG
jgi:hypothetical protein